MDRFNKRVNNAGLGGIYNNFNNNFEHSVTRNSKKPADSSPETDVLSDRSLLDIQPSHVYNTDMSSYKKRKQKSVGNSTKKKVHKCYKKQESS